MAKSACRRISFLSLRLARQFQSTVCAVLCLTVKKDRLLPQILQTPQLLPSFSKPDLPSLVADPTPQLAKGPTAGRSIG